MNRAHAIESVVIVGGGASASALALHLVRQGKRVAMFHAGGSSLPVVGESLVPAVVPHLRELGVEDEVRACGTHKPGAIFTLGDGLAFPFAFNAFRTRVPDYAYNVPRREFDEILRKKAVSEGVVLLPCAAGLEADGVGGVRLTPATLEQARTALGGSPDLLVDASGRARVFARLLGIPARRGERDDTAFFAHVDRIVLHHPGYVHTDRLTQGWAWRIPLPGRVSVGMVVPESLAARYGATPEERYDGMLKGEPRLAALAGESRRLTPVQTFHNYQMASTRMHGPGWVLLGDAAAFVDPVFSSGLLIGLGSAHRLARALARGRPDLHAYQEHVLRQIRAWQGIVDTFYNGRLFTAFRVGEAFEKSPAGKIVGPHIRRHMARIFTGEAPASRYSLGWLKLITQRGLRGENPVPLAVG